MTRGRFFAAAMPLWAIIYGMGVALFHNGTFTVVGSMVFALIAVVGATLIPAHPSGGPSGRQRDRDRNR